MTDDSSRTERPGAIAQGSGVLEPAPDPLATQLDDATLIDDPAQPSDATLLDEEAAPSAPEPAAGTPRHPDKIGHFRILDVLGEGGMGAVYLAEQSEPVARQVALKVVHTSLRSPEALARFSAERQAMARLTHPNIAALYEAGATDDGFPYFAMECVPGQALTAYCDDRQLGLEQRLRLFIDVCDGVQHAHQKGIMHRDLKPDNLLVAHVGDRDVPKVIDFGIAKALDEPLAEAVELTGMRAVGTPAYMSPEALAGSPDLDTRTDVYSLGIVLYELLVGLRPHQAAGAVVSSFQATATRGPAKRPSARVSTLDAPTGVKLAHRRGITSAQLTRVLRGDLDWITMRAIADEPERRYPSAVDLSDDIRRYLENQPVEARPPSTRYVVGKFVRRNRVAVAGAVLVTMALILGIIGTSIGLVRAQLAERDALAQADRADREASAAQQVADFLIGLFEVSDPGEARGNEVTARELLDQGANRIRRELVGQPLLRARMMGTMGDVYGKLGLYKESVALEEETLRLREAELGPDHPEVAVSLNALADLYLQQARYPAAEKAIQRALGIREAVFGLDHPAYAESLNTLAEVEVFLGQKERAEAHYRRAITIREQTTGIDPVDLATSLHHLGWLVGDQGRYQEAEIALQRALDIRESALGNNHYDVATTLGLLAEFNTYQGRFKEAEKLMLRALGIEQAVLEPEHPQIGESYLAIGTLYRFQGRLAEAENYLNRALLLFETTLGEDHHNVAFVLSELGLTLAGLERWQEAELLYRRQLEIYQRTLEPRHALIGEALNNLGWVLSDGLQRYPEGEEILRQSVAIFAAGADPDDYWNALSRWSLANNLRDQGKHADAGPYYQRAVEILHRIGGANRVDNPDLDQLVIDYVKSLRASGKHADAAALEARFSASES